MTAPVRLQLSRKKGFNLQEHSRAVNGLPAVNCARPGKWGNPFAIDKEGPLGRVAVDNASAVGFFRQIFEDPEIREASGYPVESVSELRGHNLACFCGLNHLCHVDVLLEIANRPVCEAVE